MEQQVEITTVELEARNLPALIQSLGAKIETEPQLKAVNEAKLGIRKLRNKIKDVFEPLKKSAYESYKGIMDQWKNIEAPVLEAEKSCDRLLSDYFAEQRRIREEAEKKRQEEIRRQREEEERRLQEAMKAEAEGDQEKAEQIINEVAEQEVNQKPTVIIPEKPKLDNVYSRKDYDFEIVDEGQIPRQYMIPNEILIRKIVRASQGKIVIPGIKIIVKETVVTRNS